MALTRIPELFSRWRSKSTNSENQQRSSIILRTVASFFEIKTNISKVDMNYPAETLPVLVCVALELFHSLRTKFHAELRPGVPWHSLQRNFISLTRNFKNFSTFITTRCSLASKHRPFSLEGYQCPMHTFTVNVFEGISSKVQSWNLLQRINEI